MAKTFIYQILNHYTPRENLDPGYRVLDNSSNERPDWYEYWPIRKFLLGQPLDDQAFYGFLSPRFKQKRNLSAAAVQRFIDANGTADIVLMTPSLHLTAYYWNVFQYGEACHPGLVEVATRFFERIEQPVDLQELVTHSHNEVYSNYLFAKPRFWREWLRHTERLVAIAESPGDALGMELRKPTPYRGHRDTQIKIFLMERIPTWLLARDSTFTAAAHDPFAARRRLYKLPAAVVCDALKVAYAMSGRRAQYRDLFELVSRLGRLLSLQIRLGNVLRLRAIRACIVALSTYWKQAGEE